MEIVRAALLIFALAIPALFVYWVIDHEVTKWRAQRRHMQILVDEAEKVLREIGWLK